MMQPHRKRDSDSAAMEWFMSFLPNVEVRRGGSRCLHRFVGLLHSTRRGRLAHSYLSSLHFHSYGKGQQVLAKQLQPDQ